MNPLKKVTYMELKTLRGNWEYYYAGGELKPGKVVFNYMTSKLRFRYRKYIFYVNEFPVQNKLSDPKAKDKVKVYNVTCPVSGLSLVSSLSNDEGVLRQEILRVINLPGFEDIYLSSVGYLCEITGKHNPYSTNINIAVLTALL